MKLLFILLFCTAAQTAGWPQSLNTRFGDTYVSLAYGRVSAKSKMIQSSDLAGLSKPTISQDRSIAFAVGIGLQRIRPDLYLSLSINSNVYSNFTVFDYPYNPLFMKHSYLRGAHWLYEAGLKQYIPLLKTRIFLAPTAGLNVTVTRQAKPGSDFNYDSTEQHWFRYTSRKFKPGAYAGASLNVRLGKRIMLFGEYKFQTVFADNINLGEIEYRNINEVVTHEYKSKILPYNQVITLGIAISTVNSGYYKRK